MESASSVLERAGRSDVLMAPSILSADFLDLRANVAKVADKADFIHVDVMDGHFVPNLTIGPAFVKALKKSFDTPLDVHLMVDNPEATIDWYLDAGADVVTMHAEALVHAHRAIQAVHSAGAAAGIAINPGTPVGVLRDVLEYVDLVLVMSVNPGFGGQSFIESTPRRLRELDRLCDELGVHPIVEVDGGITARTAPAVTSCGATLLVAGSAVFGADDPASAMEEIRSSAAAAISE